MCFLYERPDALPAASDPDCSIANALIGGVTLLQLTFPATIIGRSGQHAVYCVYGNAALLNSDRF